jgi:hypothetical protein
MLLPIAIQNNFLNHKIVADFGGRAAGQRPEGDRPSLASLLNFHTSLSSLTGRDIMTYKVGHMNYFIGHLICNG